jgi:hypothetical protein
VGEQKYKGLPELISFLGSPDFKTILTAVARLSVTTRRYFSLGWSRWSIPLIAAAGVALRANGFGSGLDLQ